MQNLKNFHPAVSKITNLLSDNNCWFETFIHEPVRTSEEAANIRIGYTLQQGAKALILRVTTRENSKKYVMVVLPGDKKINSSKLKQELAIKDSRFATPDEVGQITGGVLPGGVPPFGNLFELEVFCDYQIFNNEKIVFNAGDRQVSVGMMAEDYKRLVNPTLVDVI
jgi:Ala-tRNA(Pro) deacylase